MAYSSYFLLGAMPANIVKGTYDLSLVALSYVVAAFASYVALDMGGQLRLEATGDSNKTLWLLGGAFAMGAGIWSMHFIGMLAYILPMPMTYDFNYTALSMVFAITASLIAFSLLKNKNFDRIHLIAGGLILGAAIVSMHYTGMAAMKTHINVSYTPGLFILSIIIAIVASEAALWLVIESVKRPPREQLLFKFVSALIMGAAICGMHYTGMAAAVFTPLPNSHGSHALGAGNPTSLALSIAIITMVIIGMALIVSTYKQLMTSALKIKNDELAKAQGELKALNITLEERVKERTLALKEKSESLNAALQTARDASRLKSEFLANMSHELRTPLNAIIGYSEILEEDAQKQGLENFLQKLKRIIASSKHLLNLINDVLDLSKIESGKMNIFLEKTHIPTLINQLMNIITPLMQTNKNSFEVIFSDEVNEMLTDSIKLRQSLLNLLSNAAKFTNEGRVTLEVKLQKQDSKDWVHFSVKDTGIGISEEKLAKLFKPFSQVDGSATRKYGGTGLGLYLTRQFCEMLGGRVETESKIGSGSTFSIILPKESDVKVNDAALTEKKATIQVAPSMILPQKETLEFKGKSVLIIDDDPKVHHEISLLLLNSNFGVLHAFDGLEGIAFAKKYKPSIITLDVLMPNLDGWETLARLKSDSVLCNIPVILMTVLPESNANLLGAIDYVNKPIDTLLLVDKIKKITAMAET